MKDYKKFVNTVPVDIIPHKSKEQVKFEQETSQINREIREHKKDIRMVIGGRPTYSQKNPEIRSVVRSHQR